MYWVYVNYFGVVGFDFVDVYFDWIRVVIFGYVKEYKEFGVVLIGLIKFLECVVYCIDVICCYID